MGRSIIGTLAWRSAGAAVALAMAGCGSSISGADPATGIDAIVLRGPIVPVAREGENDTAPVAGARVRVRATDGDGSAAATTGPAGRTRFDLRPGSYEVEVMVCPGALGLPEATPVALTVGTRMEVTLVCDTGIR